MMRLSSVWVCALFGVLFLACSGEPASSNTSGVKKNSGEPASSNASGAAKGSSAQACTPLPGETDSDRKKRCAGES